MQLNFQEQGAGPNLVIVHGLFGSLSNWRSIAKALANDFRVLTVDLRNHGDSPHNAHMDYPAMAKDLRAFINEHADGAAHVVGHSMGGKAAMTLALEFPGAVKSMVAVDIAPVTYSGGFRRYTRAMRALDLSRIGSRSDADAQLSSDVPEPGVRAFLLQNLRREGDDWRWRINLPVIADALETISAFPDMLPKRYDGAALFLHGGESDYVTSDHWQQIVQYFPRSKRECIDGVGHWPHAEKPDVVIAALRDFLLNQS